MQRRERIVIFAIVSMLTLAIAAPSFAAQNSSEGETTATTVAPAEVGGSQSPAIPAPPPDAEGFEQPWTVRFIYPAILLLAGLLIVGLVFGYNRRVRQRYRVVG